jgi:SAM-dependent methyltransferase
VQHWLLVRGRGERRLEPEVRPSELRAHSSTRMPRVRAGDRALLYAAGWQVVFGVADVVSDPIEDPARTRWRWRFDIRPEFALHDLREAPPVQAAGVMTTSLGRHSYIRLDEGRFRRGRRAVAAAIVAAGYDEIADRFADWQQRIVGFSDVPRVERLLSLLPERAEVLELGIGAGVRASLLLAADARLTGVDVSAAQLGRARQSLPAARLVQADLLEVDFPDSSFDAVCSFYVLNNGPRDELRLLLRRAARWLRPGGYLLASLGAHDNPGWHGEWLGVPMIFGGFAPPENERLVRDAGLELLESEVEALAEPEGEARFHWVLAQRPA